MSFLHPPVEHAISLPPTPQNHAPGNKRKAYIKLASIILLLLLFMQLLGAATQLSATIDEGFHITSGYEYVRTGNVHLFDEHPPLAKALFAWPLFFVPDLPPPENAPGYASGDLIAVAQATVLAYQPIDRVIVACRVPVALLTVLLAATVAWWTTSRFGETAGLVALILFAFDPNILAHGSLATTDMITTAFIAWTLLALDKGTIYLTAVLLGMALGVKLTALLLLPVVGLVLLARTFPPKGRRAPRGLSSASSAGRVAELIKVAWLYSQVLCIAGLVLWAIYGFEVRPLPNVAHHLPLPAASHVARWLRLQNNLDYGREAFLLGQNRMHGWWQYFPIAFALKTPSPVLILFVWTLTWGAASHVKQRLSPSQMGKPATTLRKGPSSILPPLTLTLFPLLYGLGSLTSTINIGYRHLLPILPFLYIGLSRVGTWLEKRARAFPSNIALAILGLLLCWQIAGTLNVAPHYLAYFNTLAGGPDNGWRFLADSNTDWGQTLKALANYQDEQDLGPVKLSQFTFLDPATYGVEYEPIAPMRDAPPVLPRRFNPAPGLYAISATTLDGVPLPLPSTFDWFRHQTPIHKLGYAMFLYNVKTPDVPPTWVAQCTTPIAPLPPDAIVEGFGSESLRHIYFDCTQSWIFPNNGAASGWYVLNIPGEKQTGAANLHWPTPIKYLEHWPAWTHKLALNTLKLDYVQPTSEALPPFAIWKAPAGEALTQRHEDAKTQRGIILEERTQTHTLGNTLVYLGYGQSETVHSPTETDAAQTFDVLTVWHVIQAPNRPLSLMLHLRGPDGATVAVGDGLGVGIEHWRANDILVQRHRLELPPTATPGTYHLIGGAYWLDTMTHLTLENGATTFIVSEVTIEKSK